MYRLMTGRGPEAEFFQAIARRGHAGGRAGQTQQGVYVFAPSGEFLASDVSVDRNRILALLRRGLDAWAALPRDRRLMKPAPAESPEGRERGEAYAPRGGLVLRIYTRDIGGENPRSYGDRTDPWNTDIVWFRADEMKRLATPGELPSELVRRLARVHFIDFVRGLPLAPFQDRSLETAALRAEAVGRKGDVLSLRYVGETRAVEAGRGIETKVLGRAAWDVRKEAFTSFELVAAGTRWGPARGPGDNAGPGGIGFALKLAGDTPADRIAPWFWAAYGWRR